MSEIIYKKVSELDGATVPLGGTEVAMIVQGGVSKKATWQGIFGSGWWAKLTAAFTLFKALDADHADDADTLVGEAPSDFHDAAQLTGAINLDRIPAELTGKNAATATLAAACSGNATTCSGNSATATKLATARTIGGVSFDGSANINLPGVNATGNQNTTGEATIASKVRWYTDSYACPTGPALTISTDGTASIHLVSHATPKITAPFIPLYPNYS